MILPPPPPNKASVLCLVGFCLCLVLHVVSSGKRGDVCIMCILLELFNFCKQIYTLTACSAFGAGTDCNLKQRTNQRVDPTLAISAAWRSWRTGRAWPPVLLSPRSPQPSAWGEQFGRKQPEAAEHNLGQPCGVCDWFLISEMKCKGR